MTAVVLLPDHLHCIWMLPPDFTDYSTTWQRIKDDFTRKYLSAGGSEAPVSPGKTRKRERGVWQSRFWEHTIENEDDYKGCLDYIHWNPVKHGYASRPCEYPWSTFAKFVDMGEYDPLWGTGEATIANVPGAEWE
jgi:putative transposase